MTVTRLGLVVAVLILAAPLAIEAQQAGKVYRIGVLEVAGVASTAANLSAFRQGLAELGYVEGQNFVIGWRSSLAKLAAVVERGVGCSWGSSV